MDILIQRDAILKPLQAISSIVEKKQTVPIMGNVLLNTKENTLLLTGTDIETELVGIVPIETMTTPGAVTVSARKLTDICRTLTEGTLLRLSLENNSLVARTGDSYFMLNTLPVEEFPNLEEITYTAQLTTSQGALKNLFAKTYFAMAQQDVRHYLNGTCFDIKQNTITCVAADGHRLALASLQDKRIGNLAMRIVLPRKSVLELIRLLNDSDQEVTLSLSESRFHMATSEYSFTTKLINVQYPDYTRLIPSTLTTTVVGERDAIKQALTRAAILSNTDKFRGVRFHLEENKLRITANNTEQEQAEDAVALVYEKQPIEIGFNVAYLLDAISALVSKTIRFAFGDPSHGVLISTEDSNDSLYVIMPMRL